MPSRPFSPLSKAPALPHAPVATIPPLEHSPKPPRSETDLRLANHSVLGVQYAAVLCVFGAIGYAIDRWLDSLPIGLLVGIGLGFFAATYSLIRRVPPVKSSTGRSQSKPSP